MASHDLTSEVPELSAISLYVQASRYGQPRLKGKEIRLHLSKDRKAKNLWSFLVYFRDFPLFIEPPYIDFLNTYLLNPLKCVPDTAKQQGQSSEQLKRKDLLPCCSNLHSLYPSTNHNAWNIIDTQYIFEELNRGFEELEGWIVLPFRSAESEVTERKEGALLHQFDSFQVAGVTSSIFNEHD